MLKNQVRYLGVFIDSKLNFHLNVVANKVFRAIGILYKLKHVLPKCSKIILFTFSSLFTWWTGGMESHVSHLLA